eukprot:Anaeramoba_flamelloidesa826345_25.p3 GENE.a826345_25~~a826345_25.p3  ORF type:complete len:150 (-),score=8.78 a826345_25:678-1127(-)
MFRGVNPINLDAKGRMALPARYRETVVSHCEGRMVVTIDTEDPCLLLYPQPEWDEIQAKISGLSGFNRSVRRIQRLLVGHATDLELDANGRMLLPAPLRDYAELDKKIILLGQGNKFEIWSETLWSSTRDEYLQAEDDEIPAELQTLSL